jgi:hypothetical protein
MVFVRKDDTVAAAVYEAASAALGRDALAALGVTIEGAAEAARREEERAENARRFDARQAKIVEKLSRGRPLGEKQEEFSEDFGEALKNIRGPSPETAAAYLAAVDASEDSDAGEGTAPVAAPPAGLAAELKTLAREIGVLDACNGFFTIHAARIDAGKLDECVAALAEGGTRNAVTRVLAAAKQEEK